MTLSEPELGAILATLARATGLAITMPVVGDPGTPLRARLVFVVAIAVGVGLNREGIDLRELPATGVLELACGLLAGASARFVLSRVAIAGQLMGLSLGLGFASQYDVHAGESAGTLRSLLMALAGLAFLSSGGLEAVVRCAGARPAHLTDLAFLGPTLLREGTAAFGHGLSLAAPIVLAALVGNVGLAILNRAAPAVNVFSISLAAVLILGGLVLLATAGNLVGGLTEAARQATDVLSP